METAIVPDDVLRLCLDPHILFSYVKSTRRGARRPLGPGSVWSSAGRHLMNLVLSGGDEAMMVQLIISLDQLHEVASSLEKYADFSPAETGYITEGFVKMAKLGPLFENPHMILGGTGILPVPEKPQRSLETALAGRAHVLATEAIDQHLTKDAEVLEEGEVAIHDGPHRSVVIATPQKVAGWLRQGIFPDPETIRDLHRSAPISQS
jgi:hypothetical protein